MRENYSHNFKTLLLAQYWKYITLHAGIVHFLPTYHIIIQTRKSYEKIETAGNIYTFKRLYSPRKAATPKKLKVAFEGKLEK